MNDDIAFATVDELNRLLASRRISSVELTRFFLERLERYGPGYNALASLTADRAMSEAVAADAARGRGVERPLLGIPFGAKDNFQASGAPTTNGSAIYRDFVADDDAAPIARLVDAGAVLIGKLATMEFGGWGALTADCSLFGAGISPWGTARWAGGSSTGSGIAVGAGLTPFAIGSEAGGSIASPSAWCNVTGLRPTFGRVDRTRAFPLTWSVGKVGPLSRSALDCAVIFAALTDQGGPGRHGPPPFRVFELATAVDDARPLRIGYWPAHVDEHAEVAIRPVLRRALIALGDLGAELVETNLDFSSLPHDAVYYLIVNAEAAAAYGSLVDGPAVWGVGNRRQIANMRASLEIRARDYLDAMRVRRLIREDLLARLSHVDIVASYTQAGPPPMLEEVNRGGPPPEHGDEISALNTVGNLAGLPAVFLPCGLTDDGLPVSLQLVGKPMTEGLLLEIGRRYQEATDWHRARPPLPTDHGDVDGEVIA